MSCWPMSQLGQNGKYSPRAHVVAWRPRRGHSGMSKSANSRHHSFTSSARASSASALQSFGKHRDARRISLVSPLWTTATCPIVPGDRDRVPALSVIMPPPAAQQSLQAVRHLALDVDRSIPTCVKSPRDIASVVPVSFHRHRTRRCLRCRASPSSSPSPQNFTPKTPDETRTP